MRRGYHRPEAGRAYPNPACVGHGWGGCGAKPDRILGQCACVTLDLHRCIVKYRLGECRRFEVPQRLGGLGLKRSYPSSEFSPISSLFLKPAASQTQTPHLTCPMVWWNKRLRRAPENGILVSFLFGGLRSAEGTQVSTTRGQYQMLKGTSGEAGQGGYHRHLRCFTDLRQKMPRKEQFL